MLVGRMHSDRTRSDTPLFSFSFALPEHAFTGAAELTRGDESVWLQDGHGLIGYGTSAVLRADAAHRFTSLRQDWVNLVAGLRKEVDDDAAWAEAALPSGVGMVGYSAITFAEHSGQESIITVPEIVVAKRLSAHQANGFSPVSGSVSDTEPVDTWLNWVLPQREAATLLGYQHLPATLSGQDKETLKNAATQRWEAFRSDVDEYGAEFSFTCPQATLETGTIDDGQYVNSVLAGLTMLENQEVDKLVLSRDAVVTADSELPVAQILRELAARYRQCWTYSVAATATDQRLLGSTPEMLIKVQQGFVSARLLAGTLDREGADGTEDYPVRKLLRDPKQRIEHQFAIDSLTEQLGGMVSTMTAPDEPFLLQLPNVWHLASDVSAELTDSARTSGCAIMDLVERVHPTAAVCGTPTPVAARLLHQLEGYDRSWYAGPVGWLDDSGNGEFGIALRGGILETPQQLRLYAGCGVVLGSDPQVELAETWAKLRPMLQALNLAH